MPPRRRRFSRARQGAAQGFGSLRDVLAMMLQRNYGQQITQENARAQQQINQENAANLDRLMRARTREEKIANNEWDPDQDFGQEQSVARRLSGILGQIEEAPEPARLPTLPTLRAGLERERLPTRAAFGLGANLPNEEIGDLGTPEFNRALEGLHAKQEQFRRAVPPTTRTQVNQDTGLKEQVEEQWDPIGGVSTPMSGRRPVEASGPQLGRTAAEKTLTEAETELAGGLPELKGQAFTRQEDAERPAKVATSAAQAAASETARMNAYFAPQFLKQRLNESVQRVQAETRARGDAELTQAGKEAVAASAKLLPFLSNMVKLTAELNTQEFGPSARVIGMGQRLMGAAGMHETMNRFNTEIARNIRPLSVAMGVREANVSEMEQELARNGIGVRPGQTREERFHALMGLRDLVLTGPYVASVLPPEATMSERIAAVLTLGQQTRQVEDNARQAGVKKFKDPVTGAILDVITR